MTRREKIAFRKARRKKRMAKRMEKYREKIRIARDISGYRIPLSAVKDGYHSHSWSDPNSPTGRSQVCSYKGICQYPCNGDC